NMGTGRKARLHPRLCGESPGAGRSSEKGSSKQHMRIGGVGATGTRSDDYGAVPDLVINSLDVNSRRCHLDALWSSLCKSILPRFFRVLYQHAILRTFGPADRWPYLCEINLNKLCVCGIRCLNCTKQLLSLEVFFEQRNLGRATTSKSHVTERQLVDRKHCACGS